MLLQTATFFIDNLHLHSTSSVNRDTSEPALSIGIMHFAKYIRRKLWLYVTYDIKDCWKEPLTHAWSLKTNKYLKINACWASVTTNAKHTRVAKAVWKFIRLQHWSDTDKMPSLKLPSSAESIHDPDNLEQRFSNVISCRRLTTDTVLTYQIEKGCKHKF